MRRRRRLRKSSQQNNMGLGVGCARQPSAGDGRGWDNAGWNMKIRYVLNKLLHEALEVMTISRVVGFR